MISTPMSETGGFHAEKAQDPGLNLHAEPTWGMGKQLQVWPRPTMVATRQRA